MTAAGVNHYIHDLRTLLAAAPACVRQRFFDFDENCLSNGGCFRSQDDARQKAAWCEEMGARFNPAMHRGIFRDAAELLRAAIPGLPEHAPTEEPGESDRAYSESVAKADKRFARRRRRVG